MALLLVNIVPSPDIYEQKADRSEPRRSHTQYGETIRGYDVDLKNTTDTKGADRSQL
jgi:hypothetical protein